MSINPAERKALDELSILHANAQQVPCAILERDDGKFHYAFLQDDLQRVLNKKRNGNPEKANGNTTRKIPRNGQNCQGAERSAG